MAHVFISYARTDSDRASTLAKVLLSLKVPVWWDEAIRVGDMFPAAIRQKIDQASAVVVLWSRTSVRSRWVLYEAERARRRGALVPVLLEHVQLPAPFNEIDWADLTAWRPNSPSPQFEKLLLRLVEIAKKAGEHPAPGKWRVRALTKTKLLVELDSASHAIEYRGPPKGCVYVNGHEVASGANLNDQNRVFRFTLSDGLARYPADLVVRVTIFRGDVKGIRLTVADRTLYVS
jgi:hypothetical protein